MLFAGKLRTVLIRETLLRYGSRSSVKFKRTTLEATCSEVSENGDALTMRRYIAPPSLSNDF